MPSASYLRRYDPDALSFFARAGAMTTPAKVRHDQLVKLMKSLGVWSNVVIIYGADGGAIRDVSNNTPAGNNEGVHRWLNRKSNTLHIEQAVGTQQPLLQSSAIGSLPSLQFDGADDMLRLAAVTTTCRKTIFLVAMHTGEGAGGGNCLFTFGDDWTWKNQASYQERIASTRVDLCQNDIAPYDSSSASWRMGEGTGAPLNSPNIAVVTFGHSRSEMTFRRNSVSYSLTNSTPTISFNDVASRTTSLQVGQRGTGTYMRGHISFLMVLNGLMSNEHRNAVEALLKGWYGL